MATPIDAPYKTRQREARGVSSGKALFKNWGLGPGRTAIAVRDGKINKKFGRRLATSYGAWL